MTSSSRNAAAAAAGAAALARQQQLLGDRSSSHPSGITPPLRTTVPPEATPSGVHATGGTDSDEQSSMILVDGGGRITINDSITGSDTSWSGEGRGKGESWTCHVCQFVNTGKVDECIGCLALKHKDFIAGFFSNATADPSGSGNVDKESWKCRRCTFLNNPLLDRCEVCTAPKKDNVPTTLTFQNSLSRVPHPSDPTASGVWTCRHCSYSNNPSCTANCDICESVQQSYDSVSTAGKMVTPPAKIAKLEPGVDDKVHINGAGMSTIWTCPECLCDNQNRVRDCAACGTLRTPTKSDVPARGKMGRQDETSGLGAKNTWSCEKCTFKNSTSAHVCGICGAKREVLLPSLSDLSVKVPRGMVAVVGGQWSCPQCTFSNTASSISCELCQTSKSGAEQQVRGVAQNGFKGHGGTAAGAQSLPGGGLFRQNSVFCEDLRKKEEEEAKDQWTRIVHYCEINNDKFVDDSFPPIDKSLYYGPTKNSVVNNWMRPSEVDNQRGADRSLTWTVFRDPKPSDICQGVLGNCWFLSSLSVVAERADLLERILITKDYCRVGAYQVHLCKDGEWITILVDDLFPCNEHGQLVYSQAKRKQLWVPLIEKAMAKVHGCYEALTAGRCIEGLATLTGAPCESVQLSGTDQSDEDMTNLIWVQLLSCRESRFLMGASCGGGNMKADEKEYEKLGLISRHAYSILDVRDVEGNRLVQFRNPWGRFSWKGDWSDTSKLWNSIPRVKMDQLKPRSHGANDGGVFWMSLHDVFKYFDSIDICKYRPDWMESRQTGVLPSYAQKPWTAIQMEVFESTEVELGLFQEGARSQEKSKRNPVDLCIAVFRSSDVAMQKVGKLIVNGKRVVQSFVDCSALLEPGRYTIVNMAFNHWSQSTPTAPRYTLAIHSSKALLVEPMAVSETILADSLIQLALAKGERHEGRPGMTTYYLTRNWAGFIMVIENRDPDCALHVECDCSASINVVSTRATLKTVDAIPPLHRPRSFGSGLGDWAPGANHVPALTPLVYGLHAPRPL